MQMRALELGVHPLFVEGHPISEASASLQWEFGASRLMQMPGQPPQASLHVCIMDPAHPESQNFALMLCLPTPSSASVRLIPLGKLRKRGQDSE